MEQCERPTPRFGDIYYASLRPDGCLQGGHRPVIIVQNNIGNQHSPLVNVIPLSTKLKAMYMPTHTVISATPTSGLRTNSVALAEQTVPIHKEQLGNKIGQLSHDELVSVGRAFSIQFPFPAE